jgi:purine-nucleoside/S-methyl-5'-thioadenosine phosphorylase / adenosine deaminase
MTFSRIIPQWPAPASIVAFTTCRDGGFSYAPYASLNFGLEVGDELTAVQHNRHLLQQEFKHPLVWLHQTHGTDVIELSERSSAAHGDAVYTRQPHRACVIKTADCLPILVTNKSGTEVAAIHAGWRSLADGIISHTLDKLESKPNDLMAWLGPAISQPCYETGADVRDAFMQLERGLNFAFKAGVGDRYYTDLKGIARYLLTAKGVKGVFECTDCTYNDRQRFFSHRRDQVTGRMASVICITS